MRTGTQIFVEESVIQSARSVESDSESVDVGRLQKWLEGLSDDEHVPDLAPAYIPPG